MKEYLEYSQKIKKQIEERPDLIKNIKNIFERKNYQETFLGKGSENEVHRVGKLEKDIFIALRKFEKQDVKARFVFLNYFNFIESAANMYNLSKLIPEEKFRPVNFAIMTKFKESYGIITEDVSKDKSRYCETTIGEIFVKLENEKDEIERIGLDLEQAHDFLNERLEDIGKEYNFMDNISEDQMLIIK